MTSPCDSPLGINFSQTFTPIRTKRLQRLLSASGGMRELRSQKCNTPFTQKNKIIEISQNVLSEINTYRNHLKKGIPKKHLHRTTKEVEFLILRLSSTIADIEEKIEELSKERVYRKIDVDFISQEILLSLINSDASLSNALTDPKPRHVAYGLEPKLLKIENENSMLDSALKSLCQYQKILSAYEAAEKEGHKLDEVILIPSHLQKINDRIYFLGENFSQLQEIGEGAWGKVRKCRLGDNVYAVKIDKQSFNVFRSFTNPELLIDYDNISQRDVYIPLLLSHPNIIKLYGTHFDRPILEFIPSGTLSSYFDKNEILSDKSILQILIQIASAIEYMHERGIIHRDIKPDNIMIDTTQKEPRAVLIDFGTASIYGDKSRATLAGTPLYMPPETLSIIASNQRMIQRTFKKNHLSPGIDVWSFGLVAYQILAGGRDLYSERRIGKSTRTKYCFNMSTGYSTITYRDDKQFSLPYLLESYVLGKKKSRKGMQDMQIAEAILKICSQCLEKRVENRPTIATVISELNEIQKALPSNL